ncbi:MAG: peptidoglycan recognition family protein [Planctomycetota bacterium]
MAQRARAGVAHDGAARESRGATPGRASEPGRAAPDPSTTARRTGWPTGRWRRRAAAATALIGLIGACAAPQSSIPPVADTTDWRAGAQAESGRAPEWSTMAVSWGKLDQIERWLAAVPPRKGHWAIEARLQLAEGQLHFATDQLTPGTNVDIVRYRRDSAHAGFDSVLSDAGATSGQLTRAKRGLTQLRATTDTLPATAPRAAQAPVADGGLIRRSTWAARAANPSKMRRASAEWRWITVHHSVFTADNDSLAASLDTVRRIQRSHMVDKGWGDVGYHFFIDRAGRVIEGRELAWQGAHAGDARSNVANVGVCLLGNFDVERPSRAALASLDRLVLELQRKLRIPRTNVRPRKAWKNTECPGRHLMPWFTRTGA